MRLSAQRICSRKSRQCVLDSLIQINRPVVAPQSGGAQGWQRMFTGCRSTLGSLSLRFCALVHIDQLDRVDEQLQWRGASLLKAVQESLPGSRAMPSLTGRGFA